MNIDNSNGIITFTSTGESYSPPFLIPVETIVLEGASAASTISDTNGHALCTITTMDYPRPINRWVTGLVATTIGTGAQVRVYLKKGNQ